MRPFLLAILLSVTLYTMGECDSDGYFCSSNDFLAYELSFSQESAQGHQLHVVFLGGKEGISKPRSLQLPDFQVHGMKCQQDQVELLGWDKRYFVAVSKSKITLLKEDPLPAPGALPKEGYVSDNLGMESPVTRAEMPKMHVFTLPSTDRSSTYAIHITSERLKNCRLKVTSTLVQSKQEKTIKKLKVCEGHIPIECGE